MSPIENPSRPRAHVVVAVTAAASLFLAGLAAQCSSPDTSGGSAAHASVADADALRAWDVVYGVLQHPRCLNCHPAGDAPLQGDDRRLHAQNVQRGKDGKGLFAMKCAACHSTANVPGAHMPPGAPHWHLPIAAMPLVFEGRSKGELCRQMRDRAQNGGKPPEAIVTHLEHDPLVLWGWAPGEGRTPVATPHAELVEAARTWVAGGCGCPE